MKITDGDVVVDCAGATMGGALRFMQELDGYLARTDGIRAIGRSQRVNGRWLAEREFRAGRCRHTVAVNNVSFVRSGRIKTVLLRNPLHFLSDDERAAVPIGAAMRAQTVVVQQLLRRADHIVVPTSSMAERVAAHQPAEAGRIRVMHHPLSPMAVSDRHQRRDVILCPVLYAPWKRIGPGLTDLVSAVGQLRFDHPDTDLQLWLTLTPDESAALGLSMPAWGRLLGRLTPAALTKSQRVARVIAYPTTIESFGYPLAEARLARQPVVSPLTDYAREVAGDALVGYRPGEKASLVSAIACALDAQLQPLASNPFDPDLYFGRLFAPT